MRLFAPKGEGSANAPIMAAFLAGGLAGSNSWLFTYPVDYVKTIMQSQNLEHVKYRNSWECVRERYHCEGYRTFFKGLGITMLRSFPVNGTAFLSFEFVMRKMGWKKS
jgi:solute carrier family 25 carnitine/acylcarnitine transporter 20/29